MGRIFHMNSILFNALFFALLLMVDSSGCSDAELLGSGGASEKKSEIGVGDTEEVNKQNNPNDPNVNFGDGDEGKPLTLEQLIQKGEGFDSQNIACSGPNLVKNGDFEGGYQDFSTNYTWQTVPNNGYMPGPERHLTINDSPMTHHVGYRNDPNDSGQMLVINLAAVPRINFWCQSLSLKANTLYQISVRMRRAVTFDAVRSSLSEWLIDDQTFTGQFDPSGEWGTFLKTYVSAELRDVQLCGRNVAADVETADLVVDDIKFVECD